jgi:hypothetical protein
VSRADAPGDEEDDDLAGPLERISLPRALRRAAVDFYYQSIRLVPANVVWGIVLLALGWAAISLGVWVAIVGAPLLGPPLAGIYRLAGLVIRGQHVVLSDAFAAARELFVPALVAAAAVGWGLGLLALNVAIGTNTSSPLGWAFATLAGWGAVALLIYAVAVWPLLADPARAAEPARERARLAGYVVLAAPFRMFGLTVVIAVIAVVSTIAFAALVTISVAFIALVACHMVLPDADRLVEHLAKRDSR